MTDHDHERATQNKLLLLRTRAIADWELSSLLAMMKDADPGVRDWATFALAARDDDSEEVRQALLERASDADFDARSEAIWGLARRRDGRALPLLKAALEGDQIGTLFLEAAAYFARPELIPVLEELQEWWDQDTALLEEALARCNGMSVAGGRTWDLVPANERTPSQS